MGQSCRVLTTASHYFWESACFYLSLEDESSWQLKATVNQLNNLSLPFMHASTLLSCTLKYFRHADIPNFFSRMPTNASSSLFFALTPLKNIKVVLLYLNLNSTA